MDTVKKEKINRFLNDVVMANAVRESIQTSFLKPNKTAGDIHYLAASRIAIDLLDEAWRDMSRLKNETASEKKQFEQVGL